MRKFNKIKLFIGCSKIGSGATPRGGDASYRSEGISLIRSQNILDFVFSKNGLAFIDDEQASALANVEIKERDVLINITGDSVARVCQVPEYILPARVNQHVAILRANQIKLNAEFLKYALLSRENKEMLLSLASTGATRKALTKSMLEQFEINVPDEVGTNTQSRIASILSSLDDKIELNRRMNQTLEQMAQALFNHYFVDNIDPDNLPEGWQWGCYNDLVEVWTGKGLKRNEFDGNGLYNVHGANGIIGKTNKFLSDKKVLLTGRVGTLGTIQLVRDKIWISDNVLVSEPKHCYNLYFSKFVLSSFDFNSLNRGSTQPLISQSDLKNQIALLPAKEHLLKFNDIVKGFYEKIFNNNNEIFNLSKIRDALLPKLMSGEIDVDALMKEETIFKEEVN
ncbi:MAG: restriction endonuclease subunit S [Bacteroidota bacterium]|nr:restriction endonuclease subunit S [Bacteroidota bacterium]